MRYRKTSVMEITARGLKPVASSAINSLCTFVKASFPIKTAMESLGEHVMVGVLIYK